MKRLAILGLAVLAIAGCREKTTQVKQAKNHRQKVKTHFVKDNRLELFNVSVKKQGNRVVLEGKTTLPEARQAFIDSLKQAGIRVTDSIKVLPEKALRNTNGLIALSTGNIRAESSHASTLVTQGIMGMPVKVLEQQGEWYLIRTPDHYLGWIDEDGVALKNKETMEAWREASRIIYKQNFGYVYAKPKSKAATVSDLTLGNILKVKTKKSGYYQVELPDGREGYVAAAETQRLNNWMETATPAQKDLISTARTFMGFPYLWGGTSSKGVDCSGFMKMVYLMHGVVLQRDASQQTLYGKEVPLDNDYAALKPGDLLFFGRKATENREERVTHVGMYIGDKEYIHASGIVGINSLDPDAENCRKDLIKGLVRARRYIGHQGTKGIAKIQNHPYYTNNR